MPVIASGGAGRVADFPPAVAAGADAVLAASLFHFGTASIGQVKDEPWPGPATGSGPCTSPHAPDDPHT